MVRVRAARPAAISRAWSGVALIAAVLACAHAAPTEDANTYATCSAYFFMAANANSMGEFDAFYRSGEFAYNHAVRLVGEEQTLERFNAASTELNELIDRQWNRFELADARYGVVCADIYRDALNPDRQ